MALGKLGGLKGGKARVAKLSPAKRKAIAKKAAAKRWGHGSRPQRGFGGFPAGDSEIFSVVGMAFVVGD